MRLKCGSGEGPVILRSEGRESEGSDLDATNVLETLTAQDGPVLHGKKRDGGLCPTFGTKNFGFATVARSLGRPLRFTFFAVFRVVNEVFLSKKQLFTRGKNERLLAVDTE